MAKIWYSHFDSTEKDKRVLLAEDWAKYIRSFITDGIRNGGTCLMADCTGESMTTRIDCGTANIQGYIYCQEADESGRYITVAHEKSDTQNPRIDRIVLRLDRTIENRNILPTIISGDASLNPVPPELTRTANIWEISLAQVRIGANVSSVKPENITDERFIGELCGLINSVLGLDTTSWQAQFDSFIENITTSQAITFNNNLSEQNQVFTDLITHQENWFDSARGDLPMYAGFDFDNSVLYPNSETKVVFNPDGSISETKAYAGGSVYAERETVFNSDGSISTSVRVRESNGSDIWNRVITTAFEADGSITEKITDNSDSTETEEESTI